MKKKMMITMTNDDVVNDNDNDERLEILFNPYPTAFPYGNAVG